MTKDKRHALGTNNRTIEPAIDVMSLMEPGSIDLISHDRRAHVQTNHLFIFSDLKLDLVRIIGLDKSMV